MTNIVISYQCLSPRILSPLTIVDIEVDALWCDEPSDQLDGESAMFPDPVCGQDDGTAEGALARLHGAFTIHRGWVHAQLKCLATFRMAIHVVWSERDNERTLIHIHVGHKNVEYLTKSHICMVQD